jgi:hypothetical protein
VEGLPAHIGLGGLQRSRCDSLHDQLLNGLIGMFLNIVNLYLLYYLE